MSHPSRVRELKLTLYLCERHLSKSHPSRVRELKPRLVDATYVGDMVAPLPGA